MRHIATSLLNALFVAVGAAFADVKETMTNPENDVDTFTNCRSKGTWQVKNTRFRLKLTKTTGPDTDGVHCTADDYLCLFPSESTVGTSSGSFYYTLVLRAEKRNGTISVRHDTCRDSAGVCPPAALQIASYELDALCYRPDPAWTASTPLFMAFDPPHQCEGLVYGEVGEDFPEPASGIVARAGATSGCPAGPTTTVTTSTTTTTLIGCESTAAPTCSGSCFPGEDCVDVGGSCLCAANFCTGGSFPECGGSCPAGSTCFQAGLACSCVPDACPGPNCRCTPQPLVIGCGTCPAGFSCIPCHDIGTACIGAVCDDVSDCPAGSPCMDVSLCFL